MSFQDIFIFILITLTTKSIIIGSEFNIHYWFKYGKEYSSWYSKRQTYGEYLKEKSE